MARNVLCLLSMILICVCVANPQAKESTPVVVDGNLIASRVVAGQVFVRPEDFARAIGATVTYSNGGIVIKTAPGEVHRESPTLGTGTVKGTLTYFFNQNSGNRPDIGSRIYLVPGHVSVGAGGMFRAGDDGLAAIVMAIGLRNPDSVKKTLSDGNGNFEFSAVPEGEYTLIVVSNHTMDSGHYQRFDTKHLTLKPGDGFDASHDFGVSMY